MNDVCYGPYRQSLKPNYFNMIHFLRLIKLKLLTTLKEKTTDFVQSFLEIWSH